jgi:hypothetical protein
MRTGPIGIVLAAALLSSGCVRQLLTIKTEPSEAQVYVNDRLLGKSPVSYDFEWYGWHRVMIRKEGYTPVNEKKLLKAPLYLWIPLDLVMELLPFPIRDTRTWSYQLNATPTLPAPVPPDVLTVPLDSPSAARPPTPVPAATDRPVLSIDASNNAPSQEESDASAR